MCCSIGEHLEKTKRMTLEQLELDKELIKSQALSDMLESKRLVVRTVSHEMRTPLNIATTGMRELTLLLFTLYYTTFRFTSLTSLLLTSLTSPQASKCCSASVSSSTRART